MAFVKITLFLAVWGLTIGAWLGVNFFLMFIGLEYIKPVIERILD